MKSRCTFWRYRVFPMSSPGITTGNSSDRKNQGFYYPMGFKCFDGIFGTGWCVPARFWEQRRYQVLVDSHKENKKIPEDPSDSFRNRIIKNYIVPFNFHCIPCRFQQLKIDFQAYYILPVKDNPLFSSPPCK